MVIMLYKVLVVFGLVFFLMYVGLEWNWIRKYLLVFVLVVLVMFMVIYLGLSKSSKEVFLEVNVMGVVMFFFVGIFFYVVIVYVFFEVGGIGYSYKFDVMGGRGFSCLEVVVLVLGCFIFFILLVGY